MALATASPVTSDPIAITEEVPLKEFLKNYHGGSFVAMKVSHKDDPPVPYLRGGIKSTGFCTSNSTFWISFQPNTAEELVGEHWRPFTFPMRRQPFVDAPEMAKEWPDEGIVLFGDSGKLLCLNDCPLCRSASEKCVRKVLCIAWMRLDFLLHPPAAATCAD